MVALPNTSLERTRGR